ncbi:MAG: carbohydrate-binding domain-containing protein [Clostridia bacterium]|nr:carbohydrate-binding domain-containing protein [Clostridia bacterium]
MKKYKIFALTLAAALCASAAGCAASEKTATTESAVASTAASPAADAATGSADVSTSEPADKSEAEPAEETTAEDGVYIAAPAVSGGILDTADVFTNRDLRQDADLADAKTIDVRNDATETVTEEGVYVLKGTATNFTLKVDAGSEAKVQIVLDGVSITNESSPAIFVLSADKCFITTTDSENTLKTTGAFTKTDDVSTDAVIFSKDDLVFAGTGTLTVSSSDNGISGKDKIKFTGGSYSVTAGSDGIEANDGIAIADGSFIVSAGADALHAENDEDETLGWIWIAGGTLTLNASSDAVHATTVVEIDGGALKATGGEGIEGTYIQLNGGDIGIVASDDGINAGAKSGAYKVMIEITGGSVTVSVGQGDTDAIDSNGDIRITGGTIDVTASMSSFDYDGTAEFTGGTLIINGEQVDAIPQSMMGGGMGGGNQPGNGNMPGDGNMPGGRGFNGGSQPGDSGNSGFNAAGGTEV